MIGLLLETFYNSLLEERKNAGHIVDYKISSEGEMSVNKDGELEETVILNMEIVPKQTAKFVDLNFKILKDGRTETT